MLPEHLTIPFQLILPALFALGLLMPFKFLGTRKGAWVYSAMTSTISFGFSLYVAYHFNWADPGALSYVGTIPWIPGFGLEFSYGLDSMSLWLVLLTTFLMPIVVMGSLVEVKGDMRTFHFWLHILEAALIGTFIARDIVFFYVCFEFTLIPLFFLIGIFGHGEKLKAAKVFLLLHLHRLAADDGRHPVCRVVQHDAGPEHDERRAAGRVQRGLRIDIDVRPATSSNTEELSPTSHPPSTPGPSTPVSGRSTSRRCGRRVG